MTFFPHGINPIRDPIRGNLQNRINSAVFPHSGFLQRYYSSLDILPTRVPSHGIPPTRDSFRGIPPKLDNSHSINPKRDPYHHISPTLLNSMSVT